MKIHRSARSLLVVLGIGITVSSAKGLLQAESPGAEKHQMNPTLVDVPDNTWVKMSPKFDPVYRANGGFSHPHSESVCVYDSGGNVSVWWGGCSSGYTNQTWIYDCSADLWKEGNIDRYKLRDPTKGAQGGKYVFDDSVPKGGCSYGAAYDPELKGIIYGNSIQSGWVDPPLEIRNTLKPFNVWLYRAAENRWEKVPRNADPSKNRPRNDGGYMLCYDTKHKKTLMFGGLDSAGGDSNHLYEYDSRENAWKKLNPQGPLPPPRLYHTWVFDEKRGLAIAHGGRTEVGKPVRYTDTWEYNPAANSWTEIKTPNHPSASLGPAAYDAANGVVVKYCCSSRDGSSETWVYDPAKQDWLHMKPQTAPRGGSPMYLTCYDKVNNVTLVVAGDQTWVYRYKR